MYALSDFQVGKHAGAEVKVADLSFNFNPSLPLFYKKIRKGTANFAVESAESEYISMDEFLAKFLI
ncbi:MAG: hypothetical protein U9O87_08605 [Verrucomicrobiota bacterium]|nr:hypothetical protein [Verrucomicrobiota bacterium]